MGSLITTAARALAALKRVALRDDPPALALRGIAMANLGDLARARELLRSAGRAFGPNEAVNTPSAKADGFSGQASYAAIRWLGA
jgi:hypothetical protein